VSDVSKNAGPSVASWFKTAQERLLTMRVRELIYAVAGQKEGPPKRAFPWILTQRTRYQAVLL
jgi:hypothetical protein